MKTVFLRLLLFSIAMVVSSVLLLANAETTNIEILREQALKDCVSGNLDQAVDALFDLYKEDHGLSQLRRDMAEIHFHRNNFGQSWSLFMEPSGSSPKSSAPGETLVWSGMIDYLTQNYYGLSVISASLEHDATYTAYAGYFKLLRAFEVNNEEEGKQLVKTLLPLPEHPLRRRITTLADAARNHYKTKQPTKWSDTGHPRPVFESSWIYDELETRVRGVRFRTRKCTDEGVNWPFLTLQDRKTGYSLRICANHPPHVSVTINNAYYRHHGISLQTEQDTTSGDIEVETLIRPDNSISLIVNGQPLLGHSMDNLWCIPIDDMRVSFEVESPTQDYPLQNLFDNVELIGTNGETIPVEVSTRIPEIHCYRKSDDISVVNLRMVAFHPRGNKLPSNWRQRLEYAAQEYQRMHIRLFGGVSLLKTEIIPDAVEGRFNHHFYANMRYGQMHDYIKREVGEAVGYPRAPYPVLLVYADTRLEPYNPVSNYGSGGVYWLHKGFSLVTREMLDHLPNRARISTDEKTNWMGYTDRSISATWPWCVSYHEFLHGLACPHSFDEPDSIMGSGLYKGSTVAILPDSIFRYMSSSTYNDEEVIQLAKEKYLDQQYNQALPYYERACEIEPSDEQLLYEYAVCLKNTDKSEKALKISRQLVEKNDGSELYTWLMGSLYYKLGDMDKAHETFTGLLKKNPNYPYAHSYLSYIYTYSKGYQNKKKAIYHAKQSLRYFEQESEKRDMRKHIETINEKADF
jgi:tetratricopeptide (TPR) repeat protein